jgi:hypothetical protein
VAVAAGAWLAREPWWLLALLTTPLAWREIRGVRVADGIALNSHLAGAVGFEMAVAALLAAGVVLGGRA